MKTEPRDIDRIELSRFLGVEYGLEAGTLTFLPKGEDSSGYVFEGDAHSKYFVRVQPARGSAALENALRVARSVRERCVLREVVAALRTRDGSVTCLYGKYRVAAFPFIEGPTAWEAHLSEPGLAYAAQVLGRLHACDSSGWPKLPIEKFQVLFRPAILGRMRPAVWVEALMRQALGRGGCSRPSGFSFWKHSSASDSSAGDSGGSAATRS
jgi:hypothetical protein